MMIKLPWSLFSESHKLKTKFLNALFKVCCKTFSKCCFSKVMCLKSLKGSYRWRMVKFSPSQSVKYKILWSVAESVLLNSSHRCVLVGRLLQTVDQLQAEHPYLCRSFSHWMALPIAACTPCLPLWPRGQVPHSAVVVSVVSGIFLRGRCDISAPCCMWDV